PKITPLLPPAAIFHSSSSSKFSYSLFVTRSPRCSVVTSGLKRSSPSCAVQAADTVSFRYVCHPAVDLPSNRDTQPSLPSAVTVVSCWLFSVVCPELHPANIASARQIDNWFLIFFMEMKLGLNKCNK